MRRKLSSLISIIIVSMLLVGCDVVQEQLSGFISRTGKVNKEVFIDIVAYQSYYKKVLSARYSPDSLEYTRELSDRMMEVLKQYDVSKEEVETYGRKHKDMFKEEENMKIFVTKIKEIINK
ncbi:hypothetical protein ACFLUV_00785 [Elusimicrobiota bacterium]